MSSFLQRIGAFAVRRRRLVLATWLVVLVGLGAGASLTDGKFSSSFSIPGSPSQDAIDLLAERLPAANGASGRIVFAADEGEQLTSAQRSAVRDALAGVAKGDRVASVTDPFETEAVSQDGRIAFAQVTFKAESAELTNDDRAAVEAAAAPARDAGVQVELSGEVAPVEEESHTAEAIGFGVAFLVLAITFGSLLAAGMPLVGAMVGVGTGMLGVTLLSAFVELSDAVTALATMLGLAVGIDYALFVLSRHRHQVQSGMAVDASIAHAVGTAGSAVVFAGATVVIALCALAVTGVPFLTAMGLSAAATVAIAVLVNLTLIPALLGVAGRRAVKGKSDLADSAAGGKETLGGRWVRLVVRHRPLALLATILVPLALAIPALDMRLGLPDDSSAASGTTKREAYELLKTGFGPGFSGPLTVVADIPQGADAKAVADGVRERVAALDDIATVAPATLSPDKTLALIQVIPASGPSTSATEDLVHAIRDQDATVERETGARVLVTGQTAINIDVSQRMSDSLVPYLAVVVGLALILLMIAFRSLLVPVTAIAGFLLTIAASLGALVAVFQQGFLADLFGITAEGAPLVSLIPILMIGILFGLAMDYQVFLVSGMREEHAHGATPQDAVVQGFRHSARVVTAAALIMISVFAGFILPDDPIIKSIGFALAVGILIDAFVVRMTLIPALMSLLGERAWWLPKWLDRLLPDVDIEGAKLEKPATDAAEERRLVHA
jgi:RND superfamily putative drug exporter